MTTAGAIDIQKNHHPVEDTTGEEHHDHVLPISVYVKVYGALLVLTYLTVQVSYWALGSLSLPVAMVVALVKAGLVIGFFMHLRYDVRFNALVFFGSSLFVVIFFSLTMIDLLSRGALVPEAETHVLSQQANDVAAAQQTSTPAVAPPTDRTGEEGSDETGGTQETPSDHKPVGGKRSGIDWGSQADR